MQDLGFSDVELSHREEELKLREKAYAHYRRVLQRITQILNQPCVSFRACTQTLENTTMHSSWMRNALHFASEFFQQTTEISISACIASLSHTRTSVAMTTRARNSRRFLQYESVCFQHITEILDHA